MPVAARKPQASNPTNAILFFDELSLDDKIADLKSYRSVSITDTLDIETFLASTGISTYFSSVSEFDIEDSLCHFKLIRFEIQDSLDLDVVQNFTEQYIETVEEAAVDPGDSTGRIENFELDFARSSIYPSYLKEFHYSGSDLSGYSIYSDSGKGTKLFEVSFILSDGNLTQKVIQRISDNKTLTVQFNYSDDTLVSQTRSIS